MVIKFKLYDNGNEKLYIYEALTFILSGNSIKKVDRRKECGDMDFVRFLGKIYMKLDTRDTNMFIHSRQEDEEYIQRFPEPKDDIERSYNQYLCQNWMDAAPVRCFFVNVASMFLIIPYTLKYLRNGEQIQGEKQYDAVLTKDFIETLLPDDFTGTYIWQKYNQGSLTKKDIPFIAEIRNRYPFSFYFRFKCLCRIAAYSDLIRKYNPKIIFSSAEYSFTSSILTNYCEKQGIEHVNIMHGEKLFVTREAFSRFTKFYVWDEFYIKLFKSLRANKTEYLISPMHLPEVNIDHSDKRCVYYLGLHTKEELLKIRDSLEALAIDYKVRPHPLYDTPMTRKIFLEEHIEECKSVDIWDSIAHSGIVISVYSTVLYQAYLKGITIMIDDISKPHIYNKLFERDYIMLNKPHLLLSDQLRVNMEKGKGSI